MHIKKTAHIVVRDTDGSLKEITVAFSDEGIYLRPEGRTSSSGWPIKIGFVNGQPTVTLAGDVDTDNPTNLIDLVREQYSDQVLNEGHPEQLTLRIEEEY